MIPELERFWPNKDFWTMPTWKLNIYLEMLPRLQAQEQLRQIEAYMIAQPAQDDDAAKEKRQAIDKLQKQTEPEDAMPELSPWMEAVMLAGRGVKVQFVDPNQVPAEQPAPAEPVEQEQSGS